MKFRFKFPISCSFQNYFQFERSSNFSKIECPEQIEQRDGRKWQTIICSNGVIACWHPNKGFPYDHSRCVDLTQLHNEKKEFLSRINNLQDWPYGDGPEDRDLREIFYTNMQEWRPRSREDRLYKSTFPIEHKKIKLNVAVPRKIVQKK